MSWESDSYKEWKAVEGHGYEINPSATQLVVGCLQRIAKSLESIATDGHQRIATLERDLAAARESLEAALASKSAIEAESDSLREHVVRLRGMVERLIAACIRRREPSETWQASEGYRHECLIDGKHYESNDAARAAVLAMIGEDDDGVK